MVGVEAVVSLVGAPALTSQKAYIDAAVAAGVKRFIPSEFGCDTQAPYLYGQCHECVADYKCWGIDLPSQAGYCCLSQGTRCCWQNHLHLGYHWYRPLSWDTIDLQGLFFDNTLPYPVAGVNFKEGKAVIPGTGKELLSLTSRDDIGRYVAAVLKHADVTENKIIRVAGDTQTADFLVEKYEKQLGKKFDVTYRSAEELDATAQEGLKTGNLGAYFSNRIPLFTGTGVRRTPESGLPCSELKSINRQRVGRIGWTMTSSPKSRPSLLNKSSQSSECL